jgi:hypothetical protein
MVEFPVELFAKAIYLLFVSENRSPKALGPVSLCSRRANKIARPLQFQMATISTCFDIMAYQTMAENAPHLFLHVKTLRAVRLMPEWGDNSMDYPFRKSCVDLSVSKEFSNLYDLRSSVEDPPPLY